MQRDFFVFSRVDNMIFKAGLTLEEATEYRSSAIAENPEDTQTVGIASVSADPAFALDMAFKHITNW